MTIPITETPKRLPGRPKGTPKTGGRQKGTPNRKTVQTRDRIQELGDPIAFLADVMNGKRMVAAGETGETKKTWCYPTVAQRVQASETLLRKLLPDLRSIENTGNLQPAFRVIERRIIDPRSDAAEAGDAAYEVSTAEDTAKSNGAEPDTESGVEHINFRDRTRG